MTQVWPNREFGPSVHSLLLEDGHLMQRKPVRLSHRVSPEILGKRSSSFLSIGSTSLQGPQGYDTGRIHLRVKPSVGKIKLKRESNDSRDSWGSRQRMSQHTEDPDN